MASHIHGHEVMQMMLDSGKTYTRESLKQEIIEKYGPDARYFTCSSAGMDPDQLIEFLTARDKFMAQGDGFQVDESKICKDH